MHEQHAPGQGWSTEPNHASPINPNTGDFTTSNTLFDIPTTGASLETTLSCLALNLPRLRRPQRALFRILRMGVGINHQRLRIQ